MLEDTALLGPVVGCLIEGEGGDTALVVDQNGARVTKVGRIKGPPLEENGAAGAS